MKASLSLPLIILLAASACRPVLATDVAPDAAAPAIFMDDFSDPESGWLPAAAGDAQAGYADGVYRFVLNSPNQDVRSGPGLNLGDARIEVDTIRVAGDRNNRFGLLCRVSPGGDYYVFLISSDGYYGIGKVIAGQYILLGADSLLPGESIPKGTAYLHLRADCVKDRLTLYVNGKKLHEASDSDLSSGDVGLTAGTYQAGGTEIFFDNFQVLTP